MLLNKALFSITDVINFIHLYLKWKQDRRLRDMCINSFLKDKSVIIDLNILSVQSFSLSDKYCININQTLKKNSPSSLCSFHNMVPKCSEHESSQ